MAVAEAPDPEPAPQPSAPSAPTPAVTLVSGSSPLSVVLQSVASITLSELASGVAIIEDPGERLSRAESGGELTNERMPPGLPGEAGHVLQLAGQAPGSLWLSYEITGDDRTPGRHPLLRLDPEKKEWVKYTDDWRPLIAPWSKGRTLAASTSSGKLKLKVLFPFSDSYPADLPGARVDGAECDKTLKVEALAPFATGEVWMAGTCKVDGAVRRHIAVHWAAPSGTGTAAADRPAGHVVELPKGVSHRDWAVVSADDLWFLGDGEMGTSHLHHYHGKKVEEVSLPATDGGPRAIAAAEGVLWLAAERGVYKRSKFGTWESVTLPDGTPGVKAEAWSLAVVSAAGKDVYVAGKVTLPAGERHVVLRPRPAAAVVQWP